MCKRLIFTCCIVAIGVLVSTASSVDGDLDFETRGVKRQTSPGGVNETQFLTIACDQNPQDNFAVCVEQLTAYINSSAAAWCQHEQEVLDDCLVPYNYIPTNCTSQISNFNYCANETVAMYMTCLASFTRPMDLYECANVNLFEGYSIYPTTSIATSTLPTGSLSTFNTLTGPVVPASATSRVSSPTSTLSEVGVTLSPSTIPSSTPVSKSTITLTEVVTATACPPDMTDCPTSSTYLSTITTTSVVSIGSGTASSPSSMPPVPTTTVMRGAKEAHLCVLKKRTRILRRDEV